MQQFREFCLQLGGVHLIVASRSNDNLGLLFKGEVRVNVVLLHFFDLIVAHHPWVGEVPYAQKIPLCHLVGRSSSFMVMLLGMLTTLL